MNEFAITQGRFYDAEKVRQLVKNAMLACEFNSGTFKQETLDNLRKQHTIFHAYALEASRLDRVMKANYGPMGFDQLKEQYNKARRMGTVGLHDNICNHTINLDERQIKTLWNTVNSIVQGGMI